MRATVMRVDIANLLVTKLEELKESCFCGSFLYELVNGCFSHTPYRRIF